jgi:hypothetical protein
MDDGGGRGMDYGRLLRNLLLWLVPVAAVWVALTPFYNRFLIVSSGNLLRLVESPNVTELLPAAEDDNYARITRRDFPPARRNVSSLRVTDVHFHLVLLAVLFLAVPGVGWRQRSENLGWACLIAVFFHILLVFFWVKFVYATQLGPWSLEHYGAFARNFFGLGKHLLDLPFKLAFPLVMWAAFYLSLLIPGERRG